MHDHLGKTSDFAAASFGLAAPIAPDSTRSRVFFGVLSNYKIQHKSRICNE
ncbi:MAG: hypothetical protein WB443_14725 [Nitrososphaeraceae archaeon]